LMVRSHTRPGLLEPNFDRWVEWCYDQTLKHG
jgi:hypothetical protein